MLVAAPAMLLNSQLVLPAGARVRYDPVRARRLRYRRFHRASMRVTVLTVIGPHEASIMGITLYGACLAGGRRLRRREIIALRLPSGYRITGRVRWRLGTRCGVMFSTPVADFARLVSEGALVQSLYRRRRSRMNRPRLAFEEDTDAGPPSAERISRLGEAVGKAWEMIERIFAARADKHRSTMRRFD